MDTPPEVMMTSARLMPSFRALRRSSGLQGTDKHIHTNVNPPDSQDRKITENEKTGLSLDKYTGLIKRTKA